MGSSRFKALLVGNARFERDPHNLPALKGPPEDLKIFERALTDSQTGIYEPADVRTLLDATKAEVSEAIDEFFNTAAPDDQLLFYYSGHGRQDANNSLYLCTRDTRTDRLPSTAIGDVVINQMIKTSHAARTLIVLDCCHSGSFKGGGMPEALAQAGGRFLLTSCRDQQLATDASTGGGASAFTSHLVQAMVSGEVDANEDGFVTLSEVYHYLLPKLKAATHQIPQLHLDKTVGDPPLARAKRDGGGGGPDAVTSHPLAEARPVLALSDSKIDLQAVRLGEALSPVTIDVFNEGGGSLDWSATSDDAWIAIERGRHSFKVVFKPTQIGAHRGNIYVRDAGRGGSRRVSVFFDVLAPVAQPVLGVETTSLDFGRIRVGSRPAPQVIRLTNRGGGELQVRAHATNPALRVTANDDVVTVEPDLARGASLAGEVIIVSAGGRGVVRVTGDVEEGPLLAVRPGKSLDFGDVPIDAFKVLVVWVENHGTGQLEWRCQTEGSFFSVEAGDEPGAIKVSVGGGPQGVALGSIFIKSNGGDATINVRVNFTAPITPIVPPPPPPPPVASLVGWWQNANGRMLVSGQPPVYQYADYNHFGIQIGSGTITVNGPQAFLQGSSLMIPYTAQLFISGPMMTGTINCFGAQNPLSYTRC